MAIQAPYLRRSHVQRPARGFIVVAVLWILAALSALVLVYLSYVTTSAATVAAVGFDRIQADSLVMAGLEIAAYRLTSVAQEIRPTSGSFDARVGKGRVSVTFRSEAARIDLNAASKDLLAGLMVGLGAAPSDAAGYADHILSWRKASEPGENDPETSFYRTFGAPYIPRHAPFPHVEELWLVQGIPQPLIEQMLPFVTVFSNMAAINVADAAPQVLAALPDMTPEKMQDLLAQRGNPAMNRQGLLGLAGGGNATLDGAKSYRVSVAADPGGGRRASAEIVILLLDSGNDPYRVLSWQNTSDSSAGRPVER
jgi:general secretion pathway protein K